MSMSSKKLTPREVMEAYKGGGFPPPYIPVLGVSLGLGLPFVLTQFFMTPRPAHATFNESNVACLVPAFPFIAALFFSEFVFGAAARSTSPKASFSPAAAAAAAETQPFAVVQANRIHQNHIESLCIALPAYASLAYVATSDGSFDLRLPLAMMWTWCLGRVLYRVGYCYSRFPLWRVLGTVMTNGIASFSIVYSIGKMALS
jgi:hypothetical protein